MHSATRRRPFEVFYKRKAINTCIIVEDNIQCIDIDPIDLTAEIQDPKSETERILTSLHEINTISMSTPADEPTIFEDNTIEVSNNQQIHTNNLITEKIIPASTNQTRSPQVRPTKNNENKNIILNDPATSLVQNQYHLRMERNALVHRSKYDLKGGDVVFLKKDFDNHQNNRKKKLDLFLKIVIIS